MTENIGGFAALPSSLVQRLPISLDNLVVEGPEFVNHGNDFYRWRLVAGDGTRVGQVRVYTGRADERGEEVYIPARGAVMEAPFSLPFAKQFSAYLREHLRQYLHVNSDPTPLDVALRRGPPIIGQRGEGAYFLRWNVYFRDEKIGEYTVHDMDPEHVKATNHNGERIYKGRIPGYINPNLRDWNDIQLSSQNPNFLEQDSVRLRWARLPGKETPDNKYSLEWKRGDFLDIPFP